MSDFNPFAVPETNNFSETYVAVEHRTTLKNFRQQILALGVLWILFGVLLLAAFGFLMNARNAALPMQLDGVLVVVFGGSSAVYLLLGIAACCKQIWADYAGLVLTYLGLLGQLTQLNVCGLIITAVVLLQAHRVLGFAKKLKAAGIPLNTVP